MGVAIVVTGVVVFFRLRYNKIYCVRSVIAYTNFGLVKCIWYTNLRTCLKAMCRDVCVSFYHCISFVIVGGHYHANTFSIYDIQGIPFRIHIIVLT